MNAPYVSGLKALNRDPIFENLVVIDTPHNEIHEGEHFNFSDISTVGSGSTREILFITGLNPTHLIGFVNTSGAATIRFYEDTTRAGGTSLSIFNNNRTSINVYGGSAAHTPAGGVVGTLLFSSQVGGGIGSGAFGGLVRADSEWILKPSSNYLLQVTSGVASNNISILFEFYD